MTTTTRSDQTIFFLTGLASALRMEERLPFDSPKAQSAARAVAAARDAIPTMSATTIDGATIQIARAIEVLRIGWIEGTHGLQSDRDADVARIDHLLRSAFAHLRSTLSPETVALIDETFDSIPPDARH